MDAGRWDRLEVLLERAEGLPVAERTAFVERETGDDPELRAELSTLLDASNGAAEYLSRLGRRLLGPEVQGLLRDASAARDAPDPWIGRTVSHYEILDRMGGGGMGVIYRARDVRLDRQVALKFIAPEIRRDAEVRRRFLLEARAASALDHPNICTIHEIAETDDGRLFIVMPAYDGQTLRTRIESGPLAEQEALAIGEQIARALAAAHERGIAHRDVKPDNVFVTRDGMVKLLDFGLARTADSRMSGAGVEGTVAYMSPEQTRGERADERSDVWALGVILFEMLAGVRPFAADDPRTAVELIQTRQPDLRGARPALAGEIVDVVRRALAKDRAERFANGGALLEALRARRAALPPPAVPRRGAHRRALRAGAGVAGVLLTLVVVAVRTRANGPPGMPADPPVSHVLWVDDNPENNAGIVRDLLERGVQITTALSTREALATYDPAVHEVVISDVARYEGTDHAYVARAGLDLLAGLRARGPNVRVVFYTSSRAVATHQAEALAAGAAGIVADRDALLRLIGF